MDSRMMFPTRLRYQKAKSQMRDDGESAVGLVETSPTSVAGFCSRWWGNTPPEIEDTSNDGGQEFVDSLRAIWKRPVLDGGLAKDLPRLVHRVTLRTRSGCLCLRDLDQENVTGSVRTWANISRLVVTLVRELEPDRLEQVEAGLANIESRITPSTDLEMVVPELVEEMGEESRALKALKMVEQGVVLLSVHYMKRAATEGLLTKDIRSPEGWQIGFDLLDLVQVYHTRREQSVDVLSGESNHFELEYEVRATFRRDMTELTTASLRIQQLACAPTMVPEMRMELESRLLGDIILV